MMEDFKFEGAIVRSKRAFTGLATVDVATKGLQPGQLWMHAGRVGQSKTTFGINWVYNAALTGVNVIFATYESPPETVQKTIEKIRSSLREREDLLSSLLVVSPSYGRRMRDLVAFAERPIDMLVVDGPHLVTPERDARSAGERLVEVYKDAKQLALGAYGGRPIGVVLLQALNRQGRGAAGVAVDTLLENVDVATLTENADDSYEGGAIPVRMTMLKNRGAPVAEPFTVTLDCDSRWMFEPLDDDADDDADDDDDERRREEILRGV